MAWKLLRLLCFLPVTLPAVTLPALAAEPTHAHYEAYAAGLNVIDVDTDFTVEPERYAIRLAFRTVGAFGLILSSQQHTTVEGRFENGRPAPSQFYSYGSLRGKPRLTQIDYQAGQPQIRQLQPPNESEREPVPETAQHDTVDTLSALAELVHQVNQTGHCDGRQTTFDGRRLAVFEARTSGGEMLAATSRSVFAGPALRCDFVGRQLGGFLLSEDRNSLARPQIGTAWFAPLVPGGRLIPVRIAFHTRFFGEATMYLANPS